MSVEILMLIGFFACVMGLTTAAGYALVLRPALLAERRGLGAGTAASPAADSLRTLLVWAFELLGQVVPVSEAQTGAARKRLVAAGYRRHSAVPLLHGLKLSSGLVLAILLGWGVFRSRQDLSTALLFALGAAVFGYRLPDRVLDHLIRARGLRLRQALPDALDLLILCVEAGQSLDQALLDTSAELRGPHPDMSAELALVQLELRAGKSRAEALRNLAERNAESELRKLTSLLVQSDRFGTSLGPALRVHSKYLRIRARQQAEEAARKIGIKLLAPIFFLIFPAMLIVTAGPAVLQIFTQLLPMISGTVE